MGIKYREEQSGPESINRFITNEYKAEVSSSVANTDLRATKNNAQAGVLKIQSDSHGGGDLDKVDSSDVHEANTPGDLAQGLADVAGFVSNPVVGAMTIGARALGLPGTRGIKTNVNRAYDAAMGTHYESKGRREDSGYQGSTPDQRLGGLPSDHDFGTSTSNGAGSGGDLGGHEGEGGDVAGVGGGYL